MQRYQDALYITNDTDWSAIQPLVQKVMDARKPSMPVEWAGCSADAADAADGGGGMGGNQQQPADPTVTRCKRPLTTTRQQLRSKTCWRNMRHSQKAKQAKLVAAQADLRKVLTVTTGGPGDFAGIARLK